MPRFCLVGSTMVEVDKLQSAGVPDRIVASLEFSRLVPESALWERLEWEGPEMGHCPEVVILRKEAWW